MLRFAANFLLTLNLVSLYKTNFLQKWTIEYASVQET